MNPVIDIQNTTVRYRENLALSSVCLKIYQGEFVAVAGPNAAGKTTLLRTINGLSQISRGAQIIFGIKMTKRTQTAIRKDIGYVPQKDIVHTALTPETALTYVAKLRMPPDITRHERKAVVMSVLEDLDLSERSKLPILRLSGGQLKRVSIGCELLTKPRLLFLDEPTSGLDPGTEYDMMKLLRSLADQGRTVLLITHATKNVMLCDKVIFLARGGNLAFFGAPEDALVYFDQFRNDREHREKEMEFDDIYRILNDEARGMHAEWRERYLHSQAYYQAFGIEPALADIQELQAPSLAPKAERVQSSSQRVSSFRQFMILSARNLKIWPRTRYPWP